MTTETADAPSDRALFIAGALVVVLAAAPYRAFDLDRFSAPKELALHAFALALLLPRLRRAAAPRFDGADLLLALYAALGAAGALLAPDGWLAGRALAVTLSGAALFWCARGADAPTRRAVVGAAAAAAALAAAGALVQAYGLSCALFSPHRAPGGTLGNRNFAAHIAAVFAPVLVLAALRARRAGAAAAVAGAAVLAAALVLTRSRAALLALSAGGAVFLWGLRRARAALDGAAASRLKALAAAAAVGVLAALALPNALSWKSGSPYLDTLEGLADYHGGSGHVRLVQYRRSLRIAAAHPLLGAGPGNWSVVYPRYVKDFDHSIDYTTGRTINPWPSSDWIAVLSERGLPALAALAALFAFLYYGARRRGAAAEDPLEGAALAAAVAAAAVVGCFDAFLMLPAPAFLFWSLAGALSPRAPDAPALSLSAEARRRLTLAAAFVFGLAILRSAGQVEAMRLTAKARTRAQLLRAALLDPDNLQIRARLEAPKTVVGR